MDRHRRPLKEQEIIHILNEISDEMAEDSDVEGDSDADDCPDKRTSFRVPPSSGSVQLSCSPQPSAASPSPGNQRVLREKNGNSEVNGNCEVTPLGRYQGVSASNLLRKRTCRDTHSKENVPPCQARRALPIQDLETITVSPDVSALLGSGGAENSTASEPVLPHLPASSDEDGEVEPSIPARRQRRRQVISSDSEEIDNDLLPCTPSSSRDDLPILTIPDVISESEVDTDDDEPPAKKRKQSNMPFNLPHYDDWKKTGREPSFNNFRYKQGACGALFTPNLESPKEIFFEIFGKGLVNITVEQSNLYAMQKGVDLNLTEDELFAFFGILIVMGFHQLGSMKLFWSLDENFRVERIARVMPVRRILLIVRDLHLNDNTKMKGRDHPEFDKLFKLRPMLNYLKKRLPEVYQPSREISVDESMVAFDGRMPYSVKPPLEAYACQTVFNHLDGKGRVQRQRTPFEDIMLMIIWLLATPDSFRSVALRFGVSPSTLYYFYTYITEALRELAEQYIVWPGPEERARISARFRDASGFPGVIGSIDCTHVYITAPVRDANQYINRHDTYSINVQAVVDSNLLVRHVHVGEVGSMQDRRVFRRSALQAGFLRDDQLLSVHEHLVGDGGYTLTDFMMIPFSNNGHLTPQQLNFNRRLSHARVRVENAFGRAKGKWRRLKFLHARNQQNVVDHITASFTLHNMTILNGEHVMDDEEFRRPIRGNEILGNDRPNEQEDLEDENGDNMINLLAQAEARGIEKRIMIMEHLPNAEVPQ